MINKKIFSRGIIFFTMGLLFPASLALAKDVSLDRIVAVVNDDIITENQLDKAIFVYKKQLQQTKNHWPAEKTLRKQVLDHMIDRELQRQMAKTLNIEVSDDRLNSAILDIAQKNHLTIPQLQARLRQEGVDYDDYRKNFREQLTTYELQRHALAKNIVITDQEINDFLRTAPEQVSAPSTYHLQNALVPLPDEPTSEQVVAAKKQAEAVLVKLRQGMPVQQLTSEFSDLQVGDFGWRKLKDLPEVFVSYIKTLRPGEVAGPIRAGNGFHLIKLIAVQGDASHHSLTKTHVRHILIKTNAILNDEQAKETLLAMKRKIENGEKFEILAKDKSQDLISASKGGDLGWVSPLMLDPVFVKNMDQLKPGQISQPFETQYGWHLVQVLARKKMNDMKEFRRTQAREIIYRRKAEEAVQNWLHQLRSQAYVKISL